MGKTQIHIGNLLREILKSNRIKQVEAAEKLGISPQGLSTLLGKENFNTDYLFMVYDCLGINLFEIINDKISPNSGENNQRINLVISLDEARSKDILSILAQES